MSKFKFTIEIEAENKEEAGLYLKNMLMDYKRISVIEMPHADPEYEPVLPEGWNNFLVCYKKGIVIQIAEIWALDEESAREQFMDSRNNSPLIDIIGIHNKVENRKPLFIIGFDRRNNATYMDENFTYWKDIHAKKDSGPSVFAVSSQTELPNANFCESIKDINMIHFYPERKI